MRPIPTSARLAALLALACASCAPRPSGTPWARVTELTPGFLASGVAADPSLAVDHAGRVALTWVTRFRGRRRVAVGERRLRRLLVRPDALEPVRG
jgi:hypothetical protein